MGDLRDGATTVADGVIRVNRAGVNCYLVATSEGPVLVDAGLPRSWTLLRQALALLGFTPHDLVAVYLTHGHFDHVGMCDRLVREYHVPVHVHEKDRFLVRHPYRYAHELPRSPYPFRYPRALPGLVKMLAAGALAVRGLDVQGDVHPEGGPLRGGLVPVWSPGHTFGHCGFFLPDRGVLFSGDAVVTLDPYTGEAGPRIVARAATADSAAALAALPALAQTDAATLLPGHGAPYLDGARSAVREALAAGVS